jgi:YfiH family protein
MDIITSDIIAASQHGFFTRDGGVSSGIYLGLNCGLGSQDQREAVLINRGKVADHMGVSTDDLCSVFQVHSPDVVTVDTPLDSTGKKADAMVTNNPNISLGILTADCAPILFSDPSTNIVGAAHSGWQGALAGVSENTIEAMCKLGASRENITAVVGPCISQMNYEVGQEFFERFLDEDARFGDFFAQGRSNGKYQFDLPALCLHKLRSSGIKQAEWTRHCTYADPNRFYSYRRTTHHKEPDYGRLIACIRA